MNKRFVILLINPFFVCFLDAQEYPFVHKDLKQARSYGLYHNNKTNAYKDTCLISVVEAKQGKTIRANKYKCSKDSLKRKSIFKYQPEILSVYIRETVFDIKGDSTREESYLFYDERMKNYYSVYYRYDDTVCWNVFKNSNQFKYTYDAKGRIIKEDYVFVQNFIGGPIIHSIRKNEYDSKGKIKIKYEAYVDADSISKFRKYIDYQYKNDLLSKETHYDWKENEFITLFYSYDEKNRLIEKRQTSGSYPAEYAVDPQDSLKKLLQISLNTKQETITKYYYDVKDRVKNEIEIFTYVGIIEEWQYETHSDYYYE